MTTQETLEKEVVELLEAIKKKSTPADNSEETNKLKSKCLGLLCTMLQMDALSKVNTILNLAPKDQITLNEIGVDPTNTKSPKTLELSGSHQYLFAGLNGSKNKKIDITNISCRNKVKLAKAMGYFNASSELKVSLNGQFPLRSFQHRYISNHNVISSSCSNTVGQRILNLIKQVFNAPRASFATGIKSLWQTPGKKVSDQMWSLTGRSSNKLS